jgi:hypothetical protein
MLDKAGEVIDMLGYSSLFKVENWAAAASARD